MILYLGKTLQIGIFFMEKNLQFVCFCLFVVFPVDRETNNEKRQLLIHTLSTENPAQGRCAIRLVSSCS